MHKNDPPPLLLLPGSPVVVNGDEYENIELRQNTDAPDNPGEPRCPPDPTRAFSQGVSEIERQRDSSGYGSESGDMLRELVKNKEAMILFQRLV